MTTLTATAPSEPRPTEPSVDNPSTPRGRELRRRTSDLSNCSTTKSPQGKNNKRKSTSLPAETVEYLKAWMMSPEHIAHPYPTDQEKAKIVKETGIEPKQLTNWFVNNRKRFWKPRVEARLQHQAAAAAAAVAAQRGGATPTLVTPLGASFVYSTTAAGAAPRIITPKVFTTTTTIPNVSAFPPSSVVIATTGAPPAPAFNAIPMQTTTTITLPVAPTTENLPTVSEVSCSSAASSTSSDDYSSAASQNEEEEEECQENIVEESVTKETTEATGWEALATAAQDMEPVKKKQKVVMEERTLYRNKSFKEWKLACMQAKHCYDEDLPSLEEAAHMLGHAI
mmetsp:Transcript_17417/g.26626  ORF Transcript_17417/g.26626 Transcript_17417/m.26626 type:complete len:339 (+) Transcript_17417:389-1405(+)